MQADEAASEVEPAAQARHVAEVAPPVAARYRPAAQLAHADVPVDAEKVPTGHAVHCVASAAEKVPTAQLAHSRLPNLLLKAY